MVFLSLLYFRESCKWKLLRIVYCKIAAPFKKVSSLTASQLTLKFFSILTYEPLKFMAFVLHRYTSLWKVRLKFNNTLNHQIKSKCHADLMIICRKILANGGLISAMVSIVYRHLTCRTKYFWQFCQHFCWKYQLVHESSLWEQVVPSNLYLLRLTSTIGFEISYPIIKFVAHQVLVDLLPLWNWLQVIKICWDWESFVHCNVQIHHFLELLFKIRVWVAIFNQKVLH